MLKIRLGKPPKSTIRTIDQEMQQTRARYQHYLETTSDKYMARRGDVVVKDPHTMAGNAYKELRDSIDLFSASAKKANKEVVFEDARVLLENDEFVSPVVENKFATKILVSVKDKTTGKTTSKTVDKFAEPEVPFMKKISNALGELFTGKKGENIDKDLGLIG